MYKAFQKEQFGRETIEQDEGFIVYNYYEDGSLYIHILYVKPEVRNTGIGYKLEQILIDKYAPKEIYCYVDLTSDNPELSMQAILGVGYKVWQSNNEKIVFKKTME